MNRRVKFLLLFKLILICESLNFDETSVAHKITDLAKKLLEIQLENRSNLTKFEFFSPISVSAALHMCLLGAKGGTFENFRDKMGYGGNNFTSTDYQQTFGKLMTDITSDSLQIHNLTTWKTQFTDKFTEKLQDKSTPKEKQHEISIANGIFLSNNFSVVPEYKSAIESTFKGEVKLLNFTQNIEVTKVLNDWISEKTRGMIRRHYETALDKKTKYVLANTIYFNGKWLDDFQVKPKEFFVKGYAGPAISVQMLTTENDFPFYVHHACNCKVVGIPYQRNISTFYVFLPFRAEDLKFVQKCLTADVMEEIIEKLEKDKVEVWLPRFKILQKVVFKDALKKIGLTSIFLRNKTDLSLIYSNKTSQSTPVNPKSAMDTLDQMRSQPTQNVNPDFYVHEILQEVFLEVNEKGTKGAAVTSVNGISLLKGGSFQRTVEKFIVDIPFLFLIRHDPTKVPLFYGVIYEPIEME